MSDSLAPAFRLAVLLSVGLLLGGCVSSHLQVPGRQPVRLTRVDSARVTIWSAWLEKADGRLLLCGHVHRHYPAATEDTAQTQLTITLLDARNDLLLSVPAEFEPRQIPRGHRLDGYSTFAVPLDRLPEQTERIEIKACDDPIPSHVVR